MEGSWVQAAGWRVLCSPGNRRGLRAPREPEEWPGSPQSLQWEWGPAHTCLSDPLQNWQRAILAVRLPPPVCGTSQQPQNSRHGHPRLQAGVTRQLRLWARCPGGRPVGSTCSGVDTCRHHYPVATHHSQQQPGRCCSPGWPLCSVPSPAWGLRATPISSLLSCCPVTMGSSRGPSALTLVLGWLEPVFLPPLASHGRAAHHPACVQAPVHRRGQQDQPGTGPSAGGEAGAGSERASHLLTVTPH